MNNVCRIVVLLILAAAPARADDIIKDNNTNNLNVGVSWIGGVVPGTNDVAVWDATVGANTVNLGGDLAWGGVMADAGHSGNITINSGGLLTLGASGVYSWPNITFTLNNLISLAADQAWGRGGSGTTIYAGNIDMRNRTLTLTGGGAHQFKCALTNGGTLVVNHSNTKFSNGTTATNTDVIVSGALIVDTVAATPPRMKSATLRGGTLQQTAGNNNMNDLIGPLFVESGVNNVVAGNYAARTTQIESSGFTRGPWATVIFRGNNLGQNTLSPLVTNTANLKFNTPPPLAGGGVAPGTTTNGLLRGAIADTTSGGNGFGAATGGLATYDPTSGVRILNYATEYVYTLTDGQSTPDNVRLTNNTAAQASYTLASPTTVNSLSLVVYGATNSGITVAGTGTLKLASGVLYGSQTLSNSTVDDRIIVSNAVLDLNGQAGLVHFNSLNTGNSGLANGLVEIYSKISNDGGNGILFSGNGVVRLGGSATNDYTGPTVVNSGRLVLFKNTGVPAIPGDLVLPGGAVLLRSHQLPNDTDVYISGGTLHQAAAFDSGSGSSEVFHDLFMSAGTYNSGSSGSSSGTTTLHNASLSGGTWTVTKGHRAWMDGTLSLSGGLLNLTGTSDSSSGGRLQITGTVTLTNQAGGAYTAITLNNASGTAGPSLLTLLDDLAFTGHPDNTNTVLIARGAAAGLPGRILLNGDRTFTVADGPAPTDLAITAAISNNFTVAGGLIKTGPGSLALAAENVYTNPTVVSNGTLLINGSSLSPVTVEAGAVLSGTGLVSAAVSAAADATVDPGAPGLTGTLSVNGPVTLAAGALLRVDVNGGECDLLAGTASAAADGATVAVNGTGTGPWKVLTAAGGISGEVGTTAPGLKTVKLNGGTELWLVRADPGTIVVLR